MFPMMCDYCVAPAEYIWTTQHLGQQRDGCQLHLVMLLRLRSINGGEVTDRIGNPVRSVVLIRKGRVSESTG